MHFYQNLESLTWIGSIQIAGSPKAELSEIMLQTSETILVLVQLD